MLKANPEELIKSFSSGLLGWGVQRSRDAPAVAPIAPLGPPVILSLSLPTDSATMAKDGAEAPCSSGPRGAAGPGPAGPGPPAPITRQLPPSAAGISPPRHLSGGSCPPVWGTNPQPKAPYTPCSPMGGPTPQPGQETAAGDSRGCSPMALR